MYNVSCVETVTRELKRSLNVNLDWRNLERIWNSDLIYSRLYGKVV